MSIETMTWVLVRLLWVAAVATTLFPLAYAVLARFWETPEGRAVFGFAVSTAVLIDLTLVFYHWPPDSMTTIFWIECAAWGLAICTAVYATAILLVAQFSLRRR